MELNIMENMSWMQWGLIVLLSIIAYRMVKALKASPQTEKEHILKHGSQAQALVLSVDDTVMEGSGFQQKRLLLQVEPEQGRNFVAEILTTQNQRGYPDIKTGDKLSVKYNPSNHEKIILIDEGQQR